MPVGGVCEQVGQNGSQQGERDLLGVQAEDAVEQLSRPVGPLPPGLLQQLLETDAGLQTPWMGADVPFNTVSTVSMAPRCR